jgi:glutamate carboxypeptidase
MRHAGALKDANIIVVLTGDEESAGEPLSLYRRDLIDAARRSDIALAFEGGNEEWATVARRGASSWRLVVEGRQAHSSGVFGEGSGYGAIFEAARILDAFREELAGEEHLTFNPGVIVGGTDVAYDSARVAGTAAGKTNIIARSVVVDGDLRFISEEQLQRARARMREIVARHLPRTAARITFFDEYPAMSPTPGNHRVLAVYDSASRALGLGAVRALDPGRRGAGDISFVAPYIDGLDGLGAIGSGAHSPREQVVLSSLSSQAARAAVLMHRLTRMRKWEGRKGDVTAGR